jgi:hypothetical protein
MTSSASIEKHQLAKNDDDGGFGWKLKFSELVSGADADSELKVRKVFRDRVMKKVEVLRRGYINSFPFSVRKNENGTYTVFDGNHRYHAISQLISKGVDGFTNDMRISCIVYGTSLPVGLAMQHASTLNDIQRCSAGSSTLDYLRFLTNIQQQCTDKLSNTGQAPSLNTVKTYVEGFFNNNAGVSPNELSPRYKSKLTVGHALSFLKCLGPDAFQEAERLQDLDAAALFQAHAYTHIHTHAHAA